MDLPRSCFLFSCPPSVCASLFFADFSKGLHLVDHNILVQELQLLDKHKATIHWIGSFLSGRWVQPVRMDGILL